MPDSIEDLKKQFKKLKRKLRQIERLRDIRARHERKLTPEEEAKIQAYPDIRREKLAISAQLPRKERRTGSSTNDDNDNDEGDNESDHGYEVNDEGEDIGEEIDVTDTSVADISEALSQWSGTGSSGTASKGKTGPTKGTGHNSTSVPPAPAAAPASKKKAAPARPVVKKKEIVAPGLPTLPGQWAPKRAYAQVLDEHNDNVRCIQLHGDTCITGSQDTSIKVWDLKSGEVEKHLGSHTGAVTGLYYGEATGIISSSMDCSVKMWGNRDSGWKFQKEIYCYAPVLSLHSDMGKHAVAGLEDRTVRYMDMETGQIVKSFKGHEGKVYTVQLDSERGHIISGSNDGSVLLWDLREKSFVRDFQGHSGVVRSCRFLGDSSIIAGDDGYNLKIWPRQAATSASDMEVMKAERTLRVYAENSGPTECVYADDQVIVSTARNFGISGSHGTLHISSAANAGYAYSLVDTEAPMYLSLDVDSQTGRIATGSSDGLARVYYLGQEPKKPHPVSTKTFHSLHIDCIETDSEDESSDEE